MRTARHRDHLHLSYEELTQLLREARSKSAARKLKRQLAKLRADFAETLYALSEPIIECNEGGRR